MNVTNINKKLYYINNGNSNIKNINLYGQNVDKSV